MTDPLEWNQNSDSNNSDDLQDQSTTDESSNVNEPVDFQNVANESWPSFDQSPLEKPFRVKRKNVPGLSTSQKEQKFTINFVKNNGLPFFKKIATKFDIKEKRLVLYYPLTLCNKEVDWQCVVNDEDLNECMNILYTQLPGMAYIHVSEKLQISETRKQRPIEKKASRVASTHAVTREYYTHISAPMAQLYLTRAAYVQLLIGNKDAWNLLNPMMFLCHVSTCAKMIPMRNHSDVSSIVDHWKVHEEEVCQVVLKRHNYLCRKCKSPWRVFPQTSIQALEHITDGSTGSLAIEHLSDGCFFAVQGKKFKGSSQMVDAKVMKKISEMDPDFLDGVVINQRSITDFLGHSPSTSNSARSSTEATLI